MNSIGKQNTALELEKNTCPILPNRYPLNLLWTKPVAVYKYKIIQISYKEELSKFWILSNNRKKTDEVFGEYIKSGYFDTKKYLQLFHDYILIIARDDINAIDSIIEFSKKLEKEYSRQIYPRFHATILSNLSDFYWLKFDNTHRKFELEIAKSKDQANLLRKEIEDDGKKIQNICWDIKLSYPLDHYPYIWAKASRSLANYKYRTNRNDHEFLKDIKEIALIFTKDSDPRTWANIELDKADSFRNLKKYEEAIKSNQLAISFYTKNHFPQIFSNLNKSIEEIQKQIKE